MNKYSTCHNHEFYMQTNHNLQNQTKRGRKEAHHDGEEERKERRRRGGLDDSQEGRDGGKKWPMWRKPPK